MLGTNTEARLRWLLRGYIAAAVVVSLLAIAGYFGCSAAVGCSCVYSRATGTFKDPNVFAAFLVLPGLLILQRMLAGRRSQVLGGGILLLLIVMGGLFLSFSRAAWGQFVFCAILLMVLTFVTSRSPSERFRIVVVAIVGASWSPRRSSRCCCRSSRSPTCSRSARRCRRATTPAHRTFRPLLPGDLDDARLSVRHGAAAIPVPGGPAQHLSQFLHHRRLDLGRGLSHAHAGDAGRRLALHLRARRRGSRPTMPSTWPSSASPPRASSSTATTGGTIS